ncbi:MAG: hypothetical protein A4E53_04061 [Pelotomaculum sp. PtaB.Bin104]|nr:MAG: hypothetical protein A4E53_04061 [Pelotomaculum sp. PtaB.Bin104]
MQTACKAEIRPEMLAAIMATLVLFNEPMEQAYGKTCMSKSFNPWKKSGIIEIMRGREIRTTIGVRNHLW